MGKPDLGAFGMKNKVKVTEKKPTYYSNFDKIFRKHKCGDCNGNCNCKEPEDLRNLYRL